MSHAPRKPAQKDKALAQKDAALVDLRERFENMGRLVVEGAIVAKVDAFAARLDAYEAERRASSSLALPAPASNPKPESTLDVEQEA